LFAGERAIEGELAGRQSLPEPRTPFRRIETSSPAMTSVGASITLGTDKGFDAVGFVADMRALNVGPSHNNASAINARTTRHPGLR
jgi:hypothetical protein